ncbi:hypothetical protein DRO69_03040 [Candidatus Bathyarchaeota archaeon]|nr:MAG: hypothetical protein DRO69_03040 [Candidatus Bathyarchaeota archaeon]
MYMLKFGQLKDGVDWDEFNRVSKKYLEYLEKKYPPIKTVVFCRRIEGLGPYEFVVVLEFPDPAWWHSLHERLARDEEYLRLGEEVDKFIDYKTYRTMWAFDVFFGTDKTTPIYGYGYEVPAHE